MKKNFKNLIVVGTIVLLIICFVVCYFLIKPSKFGKEVKDVVNDYVMYVKLEDIIKIEYQEKYSLCDNELCLSPDLKVLNYEVFNDYISIYNDLDLKNKSVKDALTTLINLDKETKEIKVYVSLEDEMFNSDNLNDYLIENTELKEENINIQKVDNLNEEDVMKENIPNEYKVVFNSNGGSYVASVVVKEGEKVSKPENPTRDGYTFSKWTLDDKDYDFDKEITKNIVLMANWKKNKTTNTTTTTTTTTTTNKKAASTIDKINLNDNTTTSIDYENYTQPISYYFITNLGEVFPSLAGKSYINLSWEEDDPASVDCDLRINEWYAAFDKLKFDTAKENKAKEVLAGIEKKNYRGVKFETSVGSVYPSYSENHGVSYQYEYIMVPKSPLTTLYNGLINERKALNTEINGVLRDSIEVVFPGYGVYGKWESGLLTEKLCQEYNLTCDRW